MNLEVLVLHFLFLKLKIQIMKIFVFLVVVVSVSFGAFAQSSNTKANASKPAGPVLKNALDSFSYAMGLSMGSFCNKQQLTELNTTLLLKGVNDGRSTGNALLNEQQMNTIINNYLVKQSSIKASENKIAGEKFLQANAKKPGVITLASGLQYMVLKASADTTKPKMNERVKCHYQGSLIDGTVFESSVTRGQPAEFGVTEVIPGWVEALQLMTVGSKWRLFIPSNLAYGDRAMGSSIPAGSTLIFDLEVLAIVK